MVQEVALVMPKETGSSEDLLVGHIGYPGCAVDVVWTVQPWTEVHLLVPFLAQKVLSSSPHHG